MQGVAGEALYSVLISRSGLFFPAGLELCLGQATVGFRLRFEFKGARVRLDCVAVLPLPGFDQSFQHVDTVGVGKVP